MCCEIYSTGKANLPGSTRQRDLLSSFARMVTELLRHSNRSDVCERIPEHLRLCHRPKNVTRDDAPVIAHSKVAKTTRASAPAPRMCDLFTDDAEWQLGPLSAVSMDGVGDAADDDDHDDILEMAGF